MSTTSKRSSTPSRPVSGEPSSPALRGAGPTTGETSAQIVHARIPTNVPSVYADQIMDVVYGIHTTKLIFGIENGSAVQPVGIAVIPTAALLLSVLTIKENLTAPRMVEEMASRFSGVLRLMRDQPKSKNTDTRPKNKK